MGSWSRRCHLSWAVAVAELPARDTPEPSGCHNMDRGLCAFPPPCSAGRWQINTWALVIKWLIVLAGPIEAAIYRAAGARDIPLTTGKRFWQAERRRLRPRVSKQNPFQSGANWDPIIQLTGADEIPGGLFKKILSGSPAWRLGAGGGAGTRGSDAGSR